MRLLNVNTLRLELFDDQWSIPPYVILSHVWDEGEVLFVDVQEQDIRQSLKDLEQRMEALQSQLLSQTARRNADESVASRYGTRDKYGPVAEEISSDLVSRQTKSKKKGWEKINGCCVEAKNMGFTYAWVDTCCINKDSSSELSESINSMFSWYRNASVCIAYLSDLSCSTVHSFSHSTWFRRGWTLQELIAPDDVLFYDKDWEFIGLRSTLATEIASITLISKDILKKKHQDMVGNFSVATRLSWAAGRVTTRAEDRAYSLLGLFGVNMPTIYGEGEQAAFFRLQVEIFKALPDHSIFAWNYPFDDMKMGLTLGINMFAPSVASFLGASSIVYTPYHSDGYLPQGLPLLETDSTTKYTRFRHGICVTLLLRKLDRDHAFQACLACENGQTGKIILVDLNENDPGHFVRLPSEISEADRSILNGKDWVLRDVYVSHLSVSMSSQWKRSAFSRRIYKEVQMNDNQVLSLGFQRLPLSLSEQEGHSSRFAKMSFSRQLFHVGIFTRFTKTTLDLCTSITNSGCILLPYDFQAGALLYHNPKTEESFAVVLNSKSREHMRITVLEPEDHTTSGEGATPLHALGNIDWEDLSAGVLCRKLRTGWNVLLNSCASQEGRLQLHMRIYRSSSLQLNSDNNDGNDTLGSTPISIFVSEY